MNKLQWNFNRNSDIFFNSLRPRQNGRHLADDKFKCIFLNENVWIPIKISLKFVPKGSNNNNPALVQIMAWRRPGDKPLSEPMMIILLTHICVTRPQWVKENALESVVCEMVAILSRRQCDNLITGYWITAKLSCHVQNLVVITLFEFGEEHNEFSFEFELWWKNC